MSSNVNLGDRVLALVATPPEPDVARSPRPRDAATRVIDGAASKAALAAGTLALPVGPLGWATIAPEMLAVWRIQRQLVADVAALYGRSAELGPSQMLWCLFRHTAAQALRDLSVRVGERVLVRPAAQAGAAQRGHGGGHAASASRPPAACCRAGCRWWVRRAWAPMPTGTRARSVAQRWRCSNTKASSTTLCNLR